MTYAWLIATNLSTAFFVGFPQAAVNIAAAGFIAGLWAAEWVNRSISASRSE